MPAVPQINLLRGDFFMFGAYAIQDFESYVVGPITDFRTGQVTMGGVSFDGATIIFRR